MEQVLGVQNASNFDLSLWPLQKCMNTNLNMKLICMLTFTVLCMFANFVHSWNYWGIEEQQIWRYDHVIYHQSRPRCHDFKFAIPTSVTTIIHFICFFSQPKCSLAAGSPFSFLFARIPSISDYHQLNAFPHNAAFDAWIIAQRMQHIYCQQN